MTPDQSRTASALAGSSHAHSAGARWVLILYSWCDRQDNGPRHWPSQNYSKTTLLEQTEQNQMEQIWMKFSCFSKYSFHREPNYFQAKASNHNSPSQASWPLHGTWDGFFISWSWFHSNQTESQKYQSNPPPGNLSTAGYLRRVWRTRQGWRPSTNRW